VGTEDSGVILIFIYGLRCDPNFYLLYMLSLYSIKFCLSIFGDFFFNLGGIFEFIYFKKYHIFYVNYFYVN